jgi:signal transduction histidine kinase
LFVGFAYAAYLAAHGLGAFTIGGFVSVLALTTGLRLAGLDAWAGRIREPWFYTRSVLSIGGLVAFVVLVAVSGVVFAAAAFLIDPFLRPAEETVEVLLGSELSRAEQYRVLILGILVLTLPVLAVCETIAAVSRHEAELNDRLAGQERRLERDGIARDIHDGVILSTLGQVRRLSVSEEQTKLIDGLDTRLRRFQVERLAARQDRSIRSCLRRPFHHANELGLSLRLDTDGDTLAFIVEAEVAMLIERLVMIQINNSAEAGAHLIEVGVATEAGAVRVVYCDDGGGFDPELVDRASGGLARLRFDMERLGGSLRFTPRPGQTISEALLPPIGTPP